MDRDDRDHCRVGLRTLATRCVLLLLTLFIVTGGLQIEARGQGNTKKTIIHILKKSRSLYLDVYPKLKQLELVRKQEKTDAVKTLQRQLKEEISPRIKEINRLVTKLEPTSGSMREKVKNVRKMVSYFQEYVRKKLNGWNPENKKRILSMNKSTRLRRGKANPELLRRVFLGELMGKMVHPFMEKNPSLDNILSYEKQVRELYMKVLPKYLSLMSDVENARNEEEREVERVRRKARKEWNQFWNGIDERRKSLQNGINRELLLYRGRTYLPHNEQVLYKRGRRVKKQFQKLKLFRETEDVFSRSSQVRKLLIILAKEYVKQMHENLQDHGKRLLSVFERFRTHVNQLFQAQENEEEEEGRKKEQTIRRDLQIIRKEQAPDVSKDILAKIPTDALRVLSRRLMNEYGKKEKKMGKSVKRITDLTDNMVDFGERMVTLLNEFPEQYKRVNAEEGTVEKDDVFHRLEEDPEQLANVYSDLKQEVKVSERNVRVARSFELERSDEALRSEENDTPSAQLK